MNKARIVEGVSWKEIALGAMALVNAMLGYWLRLQREELKAQGDDLKAVRQNFSDISIKVAGEYVTREEVKEITGNITGQIERLSDALFKKLDKIEDKVDRKADKNSHSGD